MRETNMRKFNRLIETFHQSWSEKMLPALLASLQLSTKDGKAKLELQFGRPGLTTSSKVSLQQAILLVHRTAVGLAVLKGRHRKSGQDGGGQLCSRLPVQLLLMVLLQHQHRQWIKTRKLPIPLEKPVTHMPIVQNPGFSAETKNNNG